MLESCQGRGNRHYPCSPGEYSVSGSIGRKCHAKFPYLFSQNLRLVTRLHKQLALVFQKPTKTGSFLIFCSWLRGRQREWPLSCHSAPVPEAEVTAQPKAKGGAALCIPARRLKTVDLCRTSQLGSKGSKRIEQKANQKAIKHT